MTRQGAAASLGRGSDDLAALGSEDANGGAVHVGEGDPLHAS
jgi:hypothetical protein